MKTFWALYKKELRFLLWPGIGMVFAMNFGGLLNAINFFSPEFYSNHSLDMFGPVSVTPYSMIVYMYAVLYLSALVYRHLTTSKFQDFSLPCRRSVQLMALFAAVATWVSAVFIGAFALDTVYAVIHALFPALPRLAGVDPDYLLMTPPFVHTIPSYRIGHIAIISAWTTLLGILLSSIIMVGYIITVVMQRVLRIGILPAMLIGFLWVFLSWQIEAYVSSIVRGILPSIPDQIQFAGLYTSHLIILALFLVSALFLYERYSEV